MKKLTILAALFLAPCFALGQDVFQQVYTPFAAFRNLAWGSGSGAVNNTFWFNSLAPEDGVCVAIYNNNPTNPHTFTLVVSQSSEPQTQGFTGFARFWQTVTGTSTFPINVPANSSTSLFYATRSAAWIALTFSGTSAQAGNPDTANIVAVQGNVTSCANSAASNSVQGVLPAGANGVNINPVLVGGWQNVSGGQNNTIQMANFDSQTHGLVVGGSTTVADGSAGFSQTGLNNLNGNTVNILPTLGYGLLDDSFQHISTIRASKRYGTMTSNWWAWTGADRVAGNSYYAQQDTATPGAGQVLLVNTQAGTSGSVTPYRATISCDVACDVNIYKVSDPGASCTVVNAQKAFETSLGSVPQNTLSTNCLTPPTIIAKIVHLYIAAGTSIVFDLTGYWQGVGSGNDGFEVVNGAAIGAGNVSVTMEWTERL